MGIGWTELLVIFLVVLLIFGAKRIPEIARSLGRATREFKNAKDELISEVKATPVKSEPSGDPAQPDTDLTEPDDKQA